MDVIRKAEAALIGDDPPVQRLFAFTRALKNMLNAFEGAREYGAHTNDRPRAHTACQTLLGEGSSAVRAIVRDRALAMALIGTAKAKRGRR